MISLWLFYYDPIFVNYEGAISFCLEFLILFFVFRRYRVKKNASWGKVVGILVIAEILYFGLIFLPLAMYKIYLQGGPM